VSDTSYAGTAELARVLRLRQPTPAQGSAMQRVLDAAAFEIDSELFGSLAYPGSVYAGTPYPALIVEVNIERAVEHWQQQESPFGVIGLNEAVPLVTSRDTFERHANKLTPLKGSWGIA